MKKRILFILPIAIGFFISLAVLAYPAESDSEFSSKFSKAVSATGFTKITIDSRIGVIKVHGWNQDELRLEGVKKTRSFFSGRRAEDYIDDVSVTLRQEEDKFSIKVRHPTDSVFERATYMVDLELWLPWGMEIDINHNIGEIRVEEMASSVRVRCNIGEIYVETDLPDESKVSLGINIGTIELRVPEDTAARITAEANIGSVDVGSPFRGVASRSGFIGSEYDATIGEGDSSIDLSVNIGSINILAR